MADLLGIIGSLSRPSRTRGAVTVALEAAEQTHGVETGVLHLADTDVEPADGRALDDYGAETREAVRRVADARAFVIGTPVYRGSYSGVLKNLFDLIPRGRWQADIAPLQNRAVALVGTGATAHHFLSVDQELRPIVGFFGGYTVGTAYLHGEHFDDEGGVVSERLRERLATLGRATVELARAVEAGDALSRLGPQI